MLKQCCLFVVFVVVFFTFCLVICINTVHEKQGTLLANVYQTDNVTIGQYIYYNTNM